jgi:prolyl-tRNA synthetase
MKDSNDKSKGKGITVKKAEDFNEWYSQLVQKAELADLRYNVKGFVCYLPWSTITIKKMYNIYETILEKKGHLPLVMPSVIPERNFQIEADHVEGFAPQVFWITKYGEKDIEEKLALRPTSETALYQMYSYWVRSYNDLPFKRYQSCQVWRAEATAATKPFFRAREFHWIEAHNVFRTLEDAEAQILEDMETTYEAIGERFAIPSIFFERPQWDKFPGAMKTFAADALMGSGKVLQLPSTHLIGTNFSEAFNVKFKDEDGQEKLGFITCYGPAISRIYGAMIALHGDDSGMIIPWELAPLQIVIVPIIFKGKENAVLSKVKDIKKQLKKYSIKIDDRTHISNGEKFAEWELKGVPLRIEIGPKDIEKKQVVLVNRLTKEKEFTSLDSLKEKIDEIAETYTNNLKKRNTVDFEKSIDDAETLENAKESISNGKIVRCGFCSLEKTAFPCAEIIEKEIGAEVRGSRVKGETKTFKKCIVCNKPATKTVYLAKSY